MIGVFFQRMLLFLINQASVFIRILDLKVKQSGFIYKVIYSNLAFYVLLH